MPPSTLSENEKEVHLSAEHEFSMYINKALIDNDTGQMRWCAVASDTDPDSFEDEMSLELYSDFISRIESKELPPERHRSDFWSGGIPYLSVSHYLDFNGKGVPGEVESVYIDGKQLKSKGLFSDSALGKAVYKAVRENFSDERKSDQDKVRISIAFVDWGHVHKSNGFEFVRENLGEICPECLKELLVGESKGKVFKKGHLIHLALTRHPVNKRTNMEVERSMATQEEDAKSIVGDELGEELAQLSDDQKDELKADLVIKSDDVTSAKADMSEDDEESEEEEKKKKKDEETEKADLAPEPVSHPLAEILENFKATFDNIQKSDLSSTEKLTQMQAPMDQLAEAIKSEMSDPVSEQQEVLDRRFDQMLSMIEGLSQKVDLLTQMQSEARPQKAVESNPVRRSMTLDPNRVISPAPATPNRPLTVKELARRSVGLSN